MVNFEINDASDGEVLSENEETAVFAGDKTPLISIKARREQIVNDLFVDLQVPRWDEPEIFVRFKPISAVKFAAAMERRRKSKAENWTILANADMLIEACIGIYAMINGDENKYSLRNGDQLGNWTRFDTDLSEALGLPVERAVDVCQSLYLTEGDLIEAANKLFRWSGLANEEADEAF
jgi:hypothetical protein